ncbi:hypothetical protein SCHIN_v1c03820 [Spiroplasma chinense]|uniref:MATE family efflux transporter n=1 Tax=Spiroplasma chinense TaxID=216932 RepID=A0A5B9Y4G9_9MOLU|nr:MATE family efflux transporter [Spiroplasma chinense]QEH61579.1 hypothetical protein SCHIN_v1c03820 [Spiroplasma chinense]
MSKVKIKKEKVEILPFEKIKTPFWKVDDLKEITTMAIPIFIQLLFNILISQINLIAINHYRHGVYSEAVAKAVLSYNTLQFIPSLIATGTIVVAGNLIGQGRKEEVSKVVVTGLLINFVISAFIFATIETLSDQIVHLMNADNLRVIKEGDVVLENSELRFVSSYYRILNVNILTLSLSQVFVAGLQSMKKSTYVTIGTVIANVIDLILVSVLLYGTKLNPIWSALTIPITGVFQIIYMMFMCFKFIDFKVNRGKQLNWIYAKETLKTGLPITIEMGVWNLCNFGTGVAIAKLGGTGAEDDNPWIVLHRNANSIGQYSTAFIQAMGTVTSVFVARKIGEDDRQGAYETAINCWKAAIYATLLANILMLALSYPLLELLGSQGKSWPWGVGMLSIYAVKILFDTVNMTLLRALWSAGDLWYPILVSFVTMGIGMVALPFVVIYGFDLLGGWGLMAIYAVLSVDPISRSIIYVIRWIGGKWQKYMHIIK